MNSEVPDSPGFNGFVGAATSLPGIIPAKPSVSFVTPTNPLKPGIWYF